MHGGRGDVGGTSFCAGDLTGCAERRFARASRWVFRDNIWIDDDWFC
jgi:hypothetical protein